jgi:hypothetical protein
MDLYEYLVDCPHAGPLQDRPRLCSFWFDSPFNAGTWYLPTWDHLYYSFYKVNLDRECGYQCDDYEGRPWFMVEYYVDTSSLPRKGYVKTDGEYKEETYKWIQFRLLFEYWVEE